ncbi:1-acyl-sn-glycerol-3-phosphate acyltransferase epsilon-like isoform X1 [Ahaetulla prasina]|uniref:1-acyl-sn-glycerol-3-phosphate acyltransferase epsilon-like isoform X1 n=1 Tax=Ahaetulla prasina TaxID=499056 RepID=UPI0026471051|nr:1-acyl-sn-glycerol-3-phosphate acyltransferase epsilon-like isoform X1 [Ahaetulla prasina]
MLLSVLLHTYSMRYVLPAAVMLGTAPTYILAWGAWRLFSALLPARFYHQVDDRLYTIYQFFFENYTGVQVILYGDLPKSKENVVYISNYQVKGCAVFQITSSRHKNQTEYPGNSLSHLGFLLLYLCFCG